MTLSTIEAEFVAAASCACQAIWLRRMLEALGDKQDGSTIIFCDNIFAIKLSRNPVMHGRSKHIDVRFHFLRNLCNDGVVELEYCKSGNQLADILTKSLKQPLSKKLRKLLEVHSLKHLENEWVENLARYVMVEEADEDFVMVSKP